MTVRASLNDRMAFDHVIRVHADGTVSGSDTTGIYAPELYIGHEDGQILCEHEAAYEADARAQGWELMYGLSCQVGGLHSFLMHPSELIAGHVADAILGEPGFYVAIIVEFLPDDEDDGETEFAGWAIARRDTPCA
jgi:hypothetical protein